MAESRVRPVSSRFARLRRTLGSTLVAAGIAVPLLTPAPASAATLTPPSSIDATGSRDVTAQLQQFLAKVPHHSTISFPRGAKYRVEGTLSIRNRNDITVLGNGATFFATVTSTDRDKTQWLVENVSNLVFENMTIRGTHTNGGQDGDAYVVAREAQHGLAVQGGERIVIRNLTITDVYGDFIYVGRSPSPVFGHPENVRIHDNVMRRNGRQGISVIDASNVVIERNDIRDTRRATIAFEPLENWVVDHAVVRNNIVGPGRLMFVAGHGEGDLSDLVIENNTLVGRSIGIDLAAEVGDRRSNVLVRGNTSDTPIGVPRGTVMRFVRYDNISVYNNVQPILDNRDMSTVGSWDSCNVSSTNNDLGPEKVGEVIVLSDNYDCSKRPIPPAVQPGPTPFSGNQLMIDVGGAGSSFWGIKGCRTATTCGGYIVGGSVKPIFTPSLAGYPDSKGWVYRSMLEGDPRFAIPIRSGTYDVKLSFVEPQYTKNSQRRFHLDMERQRILAGFDLFRETGSNNTLVERTYRMTVGDGTLNIDFAGGPQPAVLSFISITRA